MLPGYFSSPALRKKEKKWKNMFTEFNQSENNDKQAYEDHKTKFLNYFCRGNCHLS